MRGEKIRSGCLTLAFAGAQRSAELLCNPCILGGSECAGRKSEEATSTQPSWGPKRGRNCYVTPAFSGVPNAKRGDLIRRSGYLTPTFLGAQKRVE